MPHINVTKMIFLLTRAFIEYITGNYNVCISVKQDSTPFINTLISFNYCCKKRDNKTFEEMGALACRQQAHSIFTDFIQGDIRYFKNREKQRKRFKNSKPSYL